MRYNLNQTVDEIIKQYIREKKKECKRLGLYCIYCKRLACELHPEYGKKRRVN